VLHKDFARYLDDEQELLENEAEESGWKMLHGVGTSIVLKE